MNDFDKKLSQLLRKPVEDAERATAKLKALADQWAKSMEASVLARTARALGVNVSERDQSEDHLLNLVAHFDSIPEVKAMREALKPQLSVSASVVCDATDEDEDVVVSLPRLRKACETRPVLFVSGTSPNAARTRELQEQLGLVEWFEVPPHSGFCPVARKVRNGSCSAVVLFQGLLNRATTTEIVDACKTCSVPFAWANKPGKGSISQALTTIEAALAG